MLTITGRKHTGRLLRETEEWSRSKGLGHTRSLVVFKHNPRWTNTGLVLLSLLAKVSTLSGECLCSPAGDRIPGAYFGITF